MVEVMILLVSSNVSVNCLCQFKVLKYSLTVRDSVHGWAEVRCRVKLLGD